MKRPNPGSKQAQAAGCICAVLDNHYGEGVPGPDGEPLFWITRGCPVHDPQEKEGGYEPR